MQQPTLSLGDNERPLTTLAGISALVKGQLDSYFGNRPFRVKAEIKDLRFNEKSSYYLLQLVEKDANGSIFSMRASIWRNAISSVKAFQEASGVILHDGMEVMMNVMVSYHVVYGLSLNIVSFDAGYTIGAMALQREANIKRLVKELPSQILVNADGIVSSPNKLLRIPPLIKNICFIGSDTSDGYNDLIKELRANNEGFSYNIDILTALVQGPQASSQIRSRLMEIAFTNPSYDVIVIGRGGGSQVDLACFDDYLLMREVALFSKPIITAIGHERNLSGLDLVSCLSVKTPTKAGALINQTNFDSLQYLRTIQSAINQHAVNKLQFWRAQVASVWASVGEAAKARLDNENLYIRTLYTQCQHFDFQSTLDRGYAVVYDLSGKAIRKLSDVPEGVFTLRLSDGEIAVQVVQDKKST